MSLNFKRNCKDIIYTYTNKLVNQNSQRYLNNFEILCIVLLVKSMDGSQLQRVTLSYLIT